MIVTFVSQCQKNALKKTRRVLDAFADRIGDNTWQTVITHEGLLAVRKLLRKTASKSTAVSCHQVKTRSRTELLWVVGRKDAFDAQGRVPVNMTEQEVVVEQGFSSATPIIALVAKLAGYFHDIGKANNLFQNKLQPEYLGTKSEPYRHEWVSLRLFQSFVDGRSDRDWLSDLVNIDNSSERALLENLTGLRDGLDYACPSPFKGAGHLAKLVAWLIVSHHKLPQSPKGIDTPPSIENIEDWLDDVFEACWISPQCLVSDWSQKELEDNWRFNEANGTPFNSAYWQTQVSNTATQLLNCNLTFEQDWFNQRFVAHTARLSLMLADHYYSSQLQVNVEYRDRNYKGYANTDVDENGQKYRKQKLDEHNILVAINAYDIANVLPRLRADLPALKAVKQLTKNVPKEFQEQYGWQDDAYRLARGIKADAEEYGFFGISMASTGKGKTRANARIMYGLSDSESCRFSVALGLRTLTLQTGEALRKDFDFKPSDLAVLIGSQAVKELHQQATTMQESDRQHHGSESSESLLKDQIELLESLPEYSGVAEKWLEHDPKILKLLQAPVLVSTIDYLIPATEGVRGGRQIAPMLRLLTSDLVLDEPDDFGLEDMPALCRLVNWAGLLGSKVLLSSATISPVFAATLFRAYQAGREQFTALNNPEGRTGKICCAWFDEFKKTKAKVLQSREEFELEHERFVDDRIKKLIKQSLPLRKAKLVAIDKDDSGLEVRQLAKTVLGSINQLHKANAVDLDSKQISIGLIRFANINPLVGVVKELVKTPSPENTVLHYCVYHSQFPLVHRSAIERQLDLALTRHSQKEWLSNSDILKAVNNCPAKNHIFVVIATPVAEVGRDHDYDWVIVEPSSMRSIIQLAGRVQRHRRQEPNEANIHILEQNYKGLTSRSPCFSNPGFESKRLMCASSELSKLRDDFDVINSVPRIKMPPPSVTQNSPRRFTSLNFLEHVAQRLRLLGNDNDNNHASLWWHYDAAWSAEIQRLQPFRSSQAQDEFCITLSAQEKLVWHKKESKKSKAVYSPALEFHKKPELITLGKGIHWWGQFDLKGEVERLSEKLQLSEKQVLQKFTHLSLRAIDADSDERWQSHPHLGVYRRLKKGSEKFNG